MKTRSRFNLTTITVLTVLVVSSFWTIPVLADESTPPPAETPLETPPAPTEETLLEEPTPIAEQLQELPEGTEVVVLNDEGDALPLASSEAAQVIHDNDPMWCPSGVAPGGAGCSPSFNLFGDSGGDANTQLIPWLEANDPAKAGVIWIAGAYDSGADEGGVTSFTLDGLTLTEMAKYALTFQGGWGGTIGSKVVDQLDPSEFNASLSILNWKGAVTLNDILITGATVNPNFGTSGTSALIVESTQSIVLNRVQVAESGNNMNGADLSNYGNGTLAPITVNESIFNNNDGTGLRVLSDGTITIRNLTANFNGQDDGAATIDYGAFVSNFNSINAGKPIVFTGLNQFKANLGSGMYLASYGAVTLNNITAYANDDLTDGDVGDGSGVIIGGSASIKMTGTNLINYNQVDGLDFTSDGVISLNNVNASNNGEGGAVLNNCLKSGFTCTVVGKSVTLTGTNIFNENGFEGLVITTDGMITISNVAASHNGSYGVYLDNCASNGTACTNTLPYAVSIKTPSTFLYNSDDGLHIRTTGAVTLKGVTAGFNEDQGVYIDNRGSLSKPQPVTLSSTNAINGNDNVGLVIYSFGKVSLSNITANDNGLADSSGMGVLIDNRAYSTVPNPDGSILVTRQPVTFAGNNTFNNNYSGGLQLVTVGDVTLNNITAVGNGGAVAGDGVYIDNQAPWYPNGVTQTSYAAKVTLNGFGIFEGNGDEGLQIFSRGMIKLNNVTASNNDGVGAYIDNRIVNTISARQPISLIGINTFNNNGDGGATIFSFGNVTLSNVAALGNLDNVVATTGVGDGVYIQNNFAWSPNSVLTSYAASVTISGFGYFEGNVEDGLDILSKGVVTLAAITANGNADDGVHILNAGDSLVPQNVTMTGFNNFNGNGGDGLFVQTDGKITISNLSAIANTGNGAWLDNFTDKKPNKFLGVTLTGVNFFQLNQGANGLYINSDGIVTLPNVNSDDNGGNGVQVITTKNLTLVCAGAFSNTGTGFLLTSGGILTLKGVHAYGNGVDEILNPGYTSLVRTWNCP